MKTTDNDMINEFAIRNFPSNTVSKVDREKDSETREKLHSQIVKKNVITFYLHQSFLCFSQTKSLGGAW